MAACRDVWVYPNGDPDATPELWYRTGECNQCGLCCKEAHNIGYRTNTGREEEAPFLPSGERSQRPLFIESLPLGAEDWDGYWKYWQRYEVTDPNPPCAPYQGNGVCALFELYELGEICRKWPILPSDLDDFPECGFSFSRIPSSTTK